MYRILIVEDDLTISGIVREALTRWGYEAQSIEDFGLVDAQFDAFSPHLVLMDVSLPRFNGFYWCQRLSARRCPSSSSLPTPKAWIRSWP